MSPSMTLGYLERLDTTALFFHGPLSICCYCMTHPLLKSKVQHMTHQPLLTSAIQAWRLLIWPYCMNERQCRHQENASCVSTREMEKTAMPAHPQISSCQPQDSQPHWLHQLMWHMQWWNDDDDDHCMTFVKLSLNRSLVFCLGLETLRSGSSLFTRDRLCVCDDWYCWFS